KGSSPHLGYVYVVLKSQGCRVVNNRWELEAIEMDGKEFIRNLQQFQEKEVCAIGRVETGL
ncbi:Hypothetical predicted protein, partial [Marmota monax]